MRLEPKQPDPVGCSVPTHGEPVDLRPAVVAAGAAAVAAVDRAVAAAVALEPMIGLVVEPAAARALEHAWLGSAVAG